MKLVSLNIEGASQGKIFFDYIASLAPQTDIFCFQEVYTSGKGAPEVYNGMRMSVYEELRTLLPDFVSFFDAKSSGYADPSSKKTDWPVEEGSVIFVRNSLTINSYESRYVIDAAVNGGLLLEGLIKAQIITLSLPAGIVRVMHTHGISRPGTKLDTPARVEQSQTINSYINSYDGLQILCGDFNLMPDTESIKILEQGMRNLIKEYKVENTRNEISWNKFGNGKQHFADYTFVSPDIKVTGFEVPYNLVSDHLPMILEVEL